MKIESITEEILDKSPSGASCHFVDLGDGWGIKFYYGELERDLAYEAQKLCAKHGLGPKVGDVVYIDGLSMPYGYVTEVIRAGITPNEWNKIGQQITEYNDKYYDVFGKYVIDDHRGNFGWKDGAIMLLDFDIEYRGWDASPNEEARKIYEKFEDSYLA